MAATSKRSSPEGWSAYPHPHPHPHPLLVPKNARRHAFQCVLAAPCHQYVIEAPRASVCQPCLSVNVSDRSGRANLTARLHFGHRRCPNGEAASSLTGCPVLMACICITPDPASSELGSVDVQHVNTACSCPFQRAGTGRPLAAPSAGTRHNHASLSAPTASQLKGLEISRSGTLRPVLIRFEIDHRWRDKSAKRTWCVNASVVPSAPPPDPRRAEYLPANPTDPAGVGWAETDNASASDHEPGDPVTSQTGQFPCMTLQRATGDGRCSTSMPLETRNVVRGDDPAST
ncbi:hypothetical protein CSOJ01_00041 [Colletotrichum sojae]|uniref:Uncharacterized protein n=1 Tax=Colletotrichum sojae TaxID=2175907 RepID=A0A8H6N6L9_9PEZI|nr:hypothetical protein CSOJ01_00041 [Colletotrichum sojae]